MLSRPRALQGGSGIGLLRFGRIMWGEGLPLIKVLAPYLDGDESDHLERVLANLGECVDSVERGCYNKNIARETNR